MNAAALVLACSGESTTEPTRRKAVADVAKGLSIKGALRGEYGGER